MIINLLQENARRWNFTNNTVSVTFMKTYYLIVHFKPSQSLNFKGFNTNFQHRFQGVVTLGFSF